MKLDLTVPSALEYFASLVGRDQDLALFEAALSLGQDEYPELDLQASMAEVDQLVARL